MAIKCSVGGCPRNEDICCGACSLNASCGACCDSLSMSDPGNCPDAEVVTGELTAFQSAVPDTIRKITDLLKMKKELEDQEKLLKQMLVEAMETYGVKSFESDLTKMVYVAPTTRSTIDSARLKKDHPDIAQQYSKTSPVSASVRVTLKGGGK